MFFVHLRDLSFIWPFREANTRSAYIVLISCFKIITAPKMYDAAPKIYFLKTY